MEVAWPCEVEEQESRLAWLTRSAERSLEFSCRSQPAIRHLRRLVLRGIGAVRGSYAWQRAVTTRGRMLGRTASNNFLVLSAARSGTTAMMDYLNCHPRIRCRSEILNPDYLSYGDPRGMSRERLKLHVESFFVKPPGLMAGAKFLTYQLDELPIGLADLIETLHQPKIIVLYREQILEQYASLKLAERTGVWHSNKPVSSEPIWLDPDKFATFAKRQRRMWQENLAVLQGREAHFVTYEQLQRQPCRAMRDVFAYLGLKNCPVKAFVAKLHDRPLSKKVANYPAFVESGIADNAVLHLQSPDAVRRLQVA